MSCLGLGDEPILDLIIIGWLAGMALGLLSVNITWCIIPRSIISKSLVEYESEDAIDRDDWGDKLESSLGVVDKEFWAMQSKFCKELEGSIVRLGYCENSDKFSYLRQWLWWWTKFWFLRREN